MEKVLILLSTYNGIRYLTDFLDSALAQENIRAYFYIRDDGSKDETVRILKDYKTTYGDRFIVKKGDNVGSTCSFFDLIFSAKDFKYYAFADQDDVWDKDKVFCAIEYIKKYSDVPAIYSSNTKLVDKDLNLIAIENKEPKTTLGSALIKNYATGCTMIFNHELMKLLRAYRPDGITYHDWWVNLVALAVGGISIFDPDSHICYRQHGDNVVGSSSSMMKKVKFRMKSFLENKYHRDNMAFQLLKGYEQVIPQTNLSILKEFCDYKKKKASMLFDKNIRTGKKLNDFLFWICILTNRA